MPRGMEVNLGPGDVVSDGVTAPPLEGAQPRSFQPMSFWPNGWMDEDATWYGSRAWPRPHCIRQGPAVGLQNFCISVVCE